MDAPVAARSFGPETSPGGPLAPPLPRKGLLRLGIEARAQSLSRASPDRAGDIQSALERLTGREAMGELFKVLAVHSPDWPVPAGFA